MSQILWDNGHKRVRFYGMLDTGESDSMNAGHHEASSIRGNVHRRIRFCRMSDTVLSSYTAELHTPCGVVIIDCPFI